MTTESATPYRDLAARWWRPAGYWGLTLSVSFGFPAIVTGTFFMPETEWGIVVGAYATVLATWATAAGIRQWGKNNGSETETNLPNLD